MQEIAVYMTAGGITNKGLLIMKKLLVALCIFISSTSFAVSVEESIEELINLDLASSGLPLPDSGVTIIKASQKSSFVGDEADNPYNNPLRLEYVNKLQEMRSTGYANRYSEAATYLISMKDKKPTSEFDSTPLDTNLKSSLSKIRLAFPYHAIPPIGKKSLIGYAPMGSWKNGWTGFVLYFNDNNLGTCKFSVNNMKTSHGGIQLIDEDITYDINEKPTDLLVEGSLSSGFYYSVGWYDDTYIRDLSCAKQTFDPKIKDQLVNFAKNLDKMSL